MFSAIRRVLWCAPVVALCVLGTATGAQWSLASDRHETAGDRQTTAPAPAAKEKEDEAATKKSAAAKKPKVRVTISKETTYITEPLRPDGYPDYFAAVDKWFSKGVTPENNSAVLFLKAVGPNKIPKDIRAKYFEMLGMTPLPETGEYFVDSGDFVERERKAGRLTVDDADRNNSFWNRFTTAQSRPWSKKEFPEWARWLEINKEPLAILTEAVKRPHRYDPCLCAWKGESLFGLLLSAVQESRDVARAFAARAMLRAGEGDVDGAWQDLQACHRLARLVSQGPSIVEALVGLTIDNIAMTGERALLQQLNLTAAQIAKMRDDLAKLPPMGTMAEKIDRSERVCFLDVVCSVARNGLSSLRTGGGRNAQSERELESAIDGIGLAMIDWDVPLRVGNSWYDRLAEASRNPTHVERMRAFATFEKEFDEMSQKLRDPRSLGTSMLFNPSKTLGQTLVSLLLPAAAAACGAEDRWAMQQQMTNVAFALAAYRAECGAYPERLADLAPKYIEKIPKDIFNNDADLHYARRGNGCALYSIGPNGRDDGGRGHVERETAEKPCDWDDIGFRLGTEKP